ncbi:hypothetical protein [Actinophytocola sp.]|uniref:hypothetical protein n=1 Tax=Actinophytocola sp. TaxID=1872138 RepID=UPI002D80E9E5|nr:hypothetical protein [Actinophytocola sp.]HET9141769.1 hypothetical protein [Actinophytocola sp.]
MVLAVSVVATLPACSATEDQNADRAGGERAGAASPAPQPAVPPAPTPAAWGQRHTWGDGLAVQLGTPAVCVPSRAAFPADIERAVKVPVLVVNDTAAPVDTVLLVVNDLQFNGAAAQLVTDIDGPCGNGVASTRVLPGTTVTTSVAVAVAAAPGELRLSYGPPTGHDKALFAGPA